MTVIKGAFKDRTIVGFVEDVEISGEKFKAKIDTGAEKSSIDIRLAAKLGLGPIIGVKRIKSASGRSVRAVIKVHFNMSGRKMHYSFNIVDRKGLKQKILIGQNILKKGFVIDPNKK